MTKEIKRYVRETEQLLAVRGEVRSRPDWERVGGEMLVRIKFYQHERLAHLIVTVAFALMTLASFLSAREEPLFRAVAETFLVMDVFTRRTTIFWRTACKNFTDSIMKSPKKLRKPL